MLHGSKPSGLKATLGLTKAPPSTTTAAQLKPRAALGDISNRNAATTQNAADKDSSHSGLLKKPFASRIPTAATRLHTAAIQPAAVLVKASSAEGPVAMEMETEEVDTYNNNSSNRRMDVADLQSPDIKRSTSNPSKLLSTTTSTTQPLATPDILPPDHPYTHNAQYNVRLLPSILAHLHASELKKQPNPSYMLRQADLTARMREILIDWLVEVHMKFRLQAETLYLCVYLIDKFLERRAVMKNKLQLVGCTALLLAAKYEEIYAPEVMDFVHIADKTYTREQILQMESIMLTALSFNITTASPYRFLQRYHMLACSLMCGGGGRAMEECVSRLRWTGEYLLELTLQEYKFLQYLPSRVAASACYIAIASVLGRLPCAALVQYTGYALEGSGGVGGCVAELIGIVCGGSKYRAVRKKYTDVKYDEASNINIISPFELCTE